ncbi:MAG: hypothetical protein K1X67_02190 [Fimbriimonadaceae bacterium]|nr:hypothetical protein [Fimbriimonadaceae bacterium]
MSTGDSQLENNSISGRIELNWPGKDRNLRPVQREDGIWELVDPEQIRQRRPLVDFETIGTCDSSHPNLVIRGERLAALETLERLFARQVRLLYMDPPRIEVDDAAAAFQGDSPAQYSTWLSTFRAHLRTALPLIRRDGYVAIQVADAEAPYARLVADELLDRENHVGTIVWQRSYAPRNQKGMKEFTSTHECILLYAFDKAFVDAVGLRQAPEGFDNPDSDIRGPWRAGHKGAKTRRETTDFNTFVGPYRWQIVAGELPPGMWRLSPLTGVIWGEPESAGLFPIEVEVQDSAGKTARTKFTIEVAAMGESTYPSEIPWLFQQIEATGELRITTSELPTLVVGRPSSILLLADGGTPFLAPPKRPGKDRYWEMPHYTLLKAYLEDMVHLGAKGDAIPAIKTHLRSIKGDVEVKNQVTWWPGRKEDVAFAGYTQDATKHLKKLAELELSKIKSSIAKHE